MPSPRVLAVAVAGLGIAAGVAYTSLTRAPSAQAATSRFREGVLIPPPTAALAPPAGSPFLTLPALRITSVNTRQSVELRLYDGFGQVDERAARRLDALLGDPRDSERAATPLLDRRTLQLVFRAAYHFAAHEVEVVSAYRNPRRRREGYHGTGQAIDFRLRGVPAATLASYLRTLPRVGVGIYTHPRTQFVHLDNRNQSFHWIDGSPPGKRWRERSLGGRTLAANDAHYTRAADWPEAAQPEQIPFEP